ncbi:MAG: DUF4301 family protein [Bacteroidetes bacterium]|nr:MAG: DUF4301 family protein [Bacteroidota bacterium]
MLTDSDLIQLQEKGITEDQVREQISYFQQGFPYLELKRAACVDDGIIRLSEEEVGVYIDFYETNLDEKVVVKFVPASGAASRMFKEFFALMQDHTSAGSYPLAVEALNRIEDFAFFEQLQSVMAKDDLDLNQVINDQGYQVVLQYILTDKGLNYGFLPKGLLTFHKYQFGERVPVEEHLVEAAQYGRSGDAVARLHFTVSLQHRPNFNALESQQKPVYEKIFDLFFEISYSEQKPSTDTIAVDLENQPFRDSDGSLLFRPGGHGALLENLNEIEGDIIFIKNVDNVVPDHLKDQTHRYKKALAGLLLQVRKEIFRLLKKLDADGDTTIEEASKYLGKQLYVQALPDKEITRSYLHSKLNRPLRVCGMVKNQGEPGGGPFWAKSSDGTISLQIVETSQVDPNDDDQQGIVQSATHFNPVDLVCSTRDYLGNKFSLLDFRDPNTGFISQKSKDGRDLKALELPGLWNGSMANWNTIFVEVPAITFNPVKTVNDLLRKEHQPVEISNAEQ